VHVQLGVASAATASRRWVGEIAAWTWHSPATPDVVAPGDPADVRAEELVGQEQDLGVRRHRLHHLDRVGGGAADVGLRLHLGGGVHVRDHDGAWMLGLPAAQLLGVDRVRQ
jgi:hypothetical protein